MLLLLLIYYTYYTYIILIAITAEKKKVAFAAEGASPRPGRPKSKPLTDRPTDRKGDPYRVASSRLKTGYQPIDQLTDKPPHRDASTQLKKAKWPTMGPQSMKVKDRK